MSDKKHNLLPVIVSSLLALLMIAAGTWLFLNRQLVQDAIDVWRYQPTAAVKAISDDITLTDQGRFVFYASHPEVNDAAAFNRNCPQREVNNPILGCYDGRLIFIYNVTETDLQGIQQVTAAHEMLHAVWLRMSQSEQDRIGTLLVTAYESIADTALHERMAYYERNEPGQLVNELHSIIGTEYANLNPELEAHYRNYFQDRSKIVQYHDNYATVFQGLRSEAETLYGELAELGKSIDTARASYMTANDQLTADIEAFNNRAANNEFASSAQFTSERAALLQRSAALERQRQALNSNIETYNQKYVRYQEVASRIQQLNSSINSMDDVRSAPTVGE